jgi:transcriptional regulator with XRE-family HTH domain
MIQLTEKELKFARAIWRGNYRFSNVDEEMSLFLHKDMKAYKANQDGWLKKARNALFLSAENVAGMLEVSRTAYSKYEECEERGTITLETLARAAEAMDCELVYAIRPKSKKSFTEILWGILFPVAIVHPWLKKCDQRRRGHALAHRMDMCIKDPKFKKKQGWSQRANRK